MDEGFTTAHSILAYVSRISAGVFNGKSCTRLSGGYANFVWRIELAHPYSGHHTVILKHAKTYAAARTDIYLSVERMLFEREALIAFRSIILASTPDRPAATNRGDEIGPNPIIRLPEVFHWDLEQNVLILEDAGDLPSIKSFLSQEPPGPERTKVAEKIGQNLGSFLALLHTIGQSADGKKYTDFFTKHDGARELCVWRTASRLKETAGKYGVNDSRIDEIVAYITNETKESEETFNMGDFWCVCAMLIHGCIH